MAWRIRPASTEDLTTVVEFNRLLALESERKELDLKKLEPGVKAILADPLVKGRYYLAVDSAGQSIGQIMVTYEWSDWRNGWFWWIQSVYVKPAHRDQKVFRSLFDHVVQSAAKEGNVIGLRLYVEKDNQRAQDIYYHSGFENSGYFVLERYPLGKGTS